MGKWISISKRLPQAGETVLVTNGDKYKPIYCVALIIAGEWRVSWNHDRFGSINIVAWQPLPRPYDEEQIMKKYPLFIECCKEYREFEGCFILNYYSKGHHDKEIFLVTLENAYDYAGYIGDVYYAYAKLTPTPTGKVVMNYRKQPCRGSFPVTVIDVN